MIYLTNGNIPLNAAYADEIVQEDNSTYQLTFRFPTSDLLWEKLKEETFLTADDLHGEQDFVIFEVEKKHGYIQVYANQVFTLLNNYLVNPISLDRQTGSTALSRFAGSITRDNPFSFFSDIEDRHTFNIGSKNAMEAFAKDKHSIIGQWGGDLVRHGYQVRLLKNGGSENESLFMYKKNLSSYQHKTSTKSLKTRITFIATVKGEGEKAPDRKLSVVVDSPLINKYSQIYEDVIEVNDQDVKDEVSLRKYGEQYYRTSLCDMMEDSLELEVVGQSDVPVQMFDIVSLFHDVYNLDVRKKITKYTYSPMGKKLKTIGFGQFKSGLANAIGNVVSDAVKGEAQQLQSDFERQLARELKNADLAFDRKTEELKNEFEDGLNATRAKAEEVKQDISNEIDKRFQNFDNASIKEARRKAEEALKSAGASSSLAQEAKRIGLDSVARLEAFKSQTTTTQTALSGDLDVLKRRVASEVNQASEYRRTTTEALSRMTGQMNGFATKSEVKQGIDGLTQTFAKMKVGSRNYAEDYDFSRGLWRYHQGDNSPRDWTISNGEYNVKGTTNTWKQMQIFSKEGSRVSEKDSTALLELELGETYTLSFQGICYSGSPNVWISLRANRTVSGNPEIMYGTFNLASSWQTYQITIPALTKPENFDFWRIILGYNEIGHVAFRKVELTRSSTRIDAGPAPEDGKTDLVVAKSEFKKTAEGLSAKMTAVERYVNQDGQRQESLQRYAREESAKQATAVRELVAKDYVGKATYQETVRAIENKFEAITNPQNGSIATQIANYKKSVDGRFADISSLLSGKANQSDFQRVKETSQLYERILGGSGSSDQTVKDNVARLVMTNQLFQTEVGRYSGNGVNRAINTTSDWGPFITRSGNDGVNLHADLHKILSSGFKAGDIVHVRMEISIDSVQRFNDKQIVAILQSYGDVTNWARAGRTFDYNIGNLQPGNNWRLIEFDTVMTGEMLKNNSWMLNLRVDGASSYKVHTKSVKVEKGNVASAWSPAPEDTEEAVRSVQSQLAGSWAVQNINSAGDIISGINLGATGHNRITGKLTHITGETLIDNAVIKSAMIDKLKTANFEAGSVTTVVLEAEAVTADKVKMNEAFANKLVASDTFTDTLTAKRGFINQLVSNNIFTNELTAQRGFIQKLVSNDAFTNDLTAKRGFIHQLVSNNIFTNELAAQRGFINQLKSQFISSTFLEGYKGWIGGFQLGTHASGSGRWITGSNHFSVGMGNGEGGDGTTALWVNWGYNWSEAGYYAWFVKNNGKMYCKNTAEFWKTPIIHGDLKVTGNIIYDGGTWVYSPIYNKLTKENSQGEDWLYLYAQGGGRDWVHMNKKISDRRYKSNIQDSQVSGLDVIEKLKTYSYRKKYDGKVDDIACGIMAQDVQKYAPEAFFENPDGAYSYRTFELVPYLIKAIQELNQKIEKMEKTIA